jgi:polysaccharide deacetylase family protein (PEP-CTERM system associated)
MPHTGGFLQSTLADTTRRSPIGPQYVLSFDVEEHNRIDVARDIHCSMALCREYARRLEARTYEILAWLATTKQRATFFVVGALGRSHKELVRAIVAQGHEVAAHGWRHERVDAMELAAFREDVRRCKHTLEDVTGREVMGYRAPCFSINHRTPWVVDVLVECGYRYDASVYPVRHDHYGLPQAPRHPFWLGGLKHRILELPALTWRCLGRNWAVGGGGHFRLWPLAMVHAGLRQVKELAIPVGVLYFHPWEFDPKQPRLPLRGLRRWRTYVGIHRAAPRLRHLLQLYRFVAARDVVEELATWANPMVLFTLKPSTPTGCRC